MSSDELPLRWGMWFADPHQEEGYLVYLLRGAEKEMLTTAVLLVVLFTTQAVRFGPSFRDATAPVALFVVGSVGCALFLGTLWIFTYLRQKAASTHSTAHRRSSTVLVHPRMLECLVITASISLTLIAIADLSATPECPWLNAYARTAASVAAVKDVTLNNRSATTCAASNGIGNLSSDNVLNEVIDLLNWDASRAACFRAIGNDVLLASAMHVGSVFSLRLLPSLLLLLLQVVAVAAVNFCNLRQVHDRSRQVESIMTVLLCTTTTSTSGAGGGSDSVPFAVNLWDSMSMWRWYAAKLVLFSVIAAALAFIAWKRDSFRRRLFVQSGQLDDVVQQIKELNDVLSKQVLATLPMHVVSRLLARQSIRDWVPNAGIMALGIFDFSLWSSHRGSAEIVETLNRVFCLLDAETSRFPAVTKMQTLGDLYIALTGLNEGGSLSSQNLEAAGANAKMLRLHSTNNIFRFTNAIKRTIDVKFSHVPITIALHVGSVTATILPSTATYVAVGEGIHTCVRLLRSSTTTGLVSTSTFQQCLGEATIAFSAAPTHHVQRRRGSLAPSPSASLHQQEPEPSLTPSPEQHEMVTVHRIDSSHSLDGRGPTPSEGGTSETRNISVDDILRLRSALERGDGFASSLTDPVVSTSRSEWISGEVKLVSECSKRIAHVYQTEPSWFPLEKRFAREDINAAFEEYCAAIDANPLRQHWRLFLDAIPFLLYLLLACVASTPSNDPSVAVALSFVVLAGLCDLLDLTQQLRMVRTALSSKALYIVSIVALIVANFVFPPTWASVSGLSVWSMLLQFRDNLRTIATRPHVSLLRDVAFICVPLAAAQVTHLVRYVQASPQRLFADSASLENVAALCDNSRIIVSVTLQAVGTGVVFPAFVLWAFRIHRLEVHRDAFQQKGSIDLQQAHLEDQRHILQTHIRSVIPRHMQLRFSAFSNNHVGSSQYQPLSDVSQVDPWRGAWFATNVVETPILVLQIGVHFHSADDIGTEVGPQHMLNHLENAHKKLESVARTLTTVCQGKAAGDVVIFIGSEDDSEAVRAMHLLEYSAAIARAFEGDVGVSPKLVLNSGPAVGAVIGSERLSFELFGEVVSTSIALLDAMPSRGVIATRRFIMLYMQLSSLVSLVPRVSTASHAPQHELQQGPPPSEPAEWQAVPSATDAQAPTHEAAPHEDTHMLEFQLSTPPSLQRFGGGGGGADILEEALIAMETDAGIFPIPEVELLPAESPPSSELRHDDNDDSLVPFPLRDGKKHHPHQHQSSGSGPDVLGKHLHGSDPRIESLISRHTPPPQQSNREESLRSQAAFGDSNSGRPPPPATAAATGFRAPPPLPCLDHHALKFAVPEGLTVDMARSCRPSQMQRRCDPLAHEVHIGDAQHWRVRGCGTVAVHVVRLNTQQ